MGMISTRRVNYNNPSINMNDRRSYAQRIGRLEVFQTIETEAKRAGEATTEAAYNLRVQRLKSYLRNL